MSAPVFAVLYRFYLLPGMEEEYITHWKTVANFFVKERGALGSTLHKSQEGYWVAYSKWPSKAVRDASWSKDEDVFAALPTLVQQAIKSIKSCADVDRGEFPEICMEIVEAIDSKKF